MDYFTDAVLRAPTIGSMLMCLSAALVGVIAFLRKQSLLGESLSHAAFPGVIFGVIIAGILSLRSYHELQVTFLIMTGAFISAMLGLVGIHLLENRFKVKADAALCFILSAFFGIGLTMASQIQFIYSGLYKQSLTYLYGQAATMTDIHILIYGCLSLVIILVLFVFYKELQVITFDREYAKSLDISVTFIDLITFVLIVLAIVIGIRSVGVVLMSAMLIAPAAAARQFTNKLAYMMVIAAFFGLISGYLGNVFSVEFTEILKKWYPDERIALPTGPMIVMVATIICLFSLLFAPERGLAIRFFRIAFFRYRCIRENTLKAIWRISPNGEVTIEEIRKNQMMSKPYLQLVLIRLVHHGWIEKKGKNKYQLTHEGSSWAAKIVRLHRLWEVYLADYLGVGAEKVHRNAEEMEHIITPELEEELILLLKDPKEDPHHQPIPPREV